MLISIPRQVIVSALLLGMAGCASISEEECLQGNWLEIGQRDGQTGKSSSYILEHAEACKEVGVQPDQKAWERGRQDGLRAYCTPSNMYNLGKSGRTASPVCPAGDMAALQSANDQGLTYYRLTNEINRNRSEISDLQEKLVKEQDEDLRRVYLANIQRLQESIRLLEFQRRIEGVL
jgi:hypothetical protein